MWYMEITVLIFLKITCLTVKKFLILPAASTPSAFPSNTSASAETAVCSRCPPDWQQFPDWSLCIKQKYTTVNMFCICMCVLSFHVLINLSHLQVGSLFELCVLAHLWWRFPSPGNCTCIGVILPSSSYGNWWGPGRTGASPVSPPSPPLWTAGSLKRSTEDSQQEKSADQNDYLNMVFIPKFQKIH